jgi:hypothetical protein
MDACNLPFVLWSFLAFFDLYTPMNYGAFYASLLLFVEMNEWKNLGHLVS